MSLEKGARNSLVIFFTFLLLCVKPVFAQEVFSSFIILNDQPLENPAWVEYFADDEGKSLLHTAEIIDSMKEIFAQEFYKKIKENLDGENRISFSDLNKIGIKTNMDLNSLNLGLTVSVEQKKLTEVQLSNQKKRSEIKDLYKAEPFSGYFNLRSSVEFLGNNLTTTSAEQFNTSTTLSFEPVLNFYGVVFESQYIFNEAELNNISEDRRAFSRFVFDDQKKAVRYTLGDLNEVSRGFQEVDFGIGFNFRKELTIKPNLFRSSFKRHKFYLQTDSKVEIFVNGKLVKKVFLKQGPVELSDFPFISGENEVRVQITDIFGNIKNLNYSDLNDSRILPKGFSDYSVSLLFPRRLDDTLGIGFGDDIYNYSDYNLNGYYHYGAFVDGVIGLDWQISKDRYLVGFETIYGQEEGLVKLNLAQSGNEDLDLNGFGLRLEYENLIFRDGKLSDFRLISGLEYKTKGFTTLSSTGENETEYIANFSVGQNFKNSIRGSLGFAKEWGYVPTADRNFITSNFGWTFLKNFDFSANIRFNLDDTDDSTILFSLNWYAPTNDQQSTTTYDPINEVVSTEYVSFPVRNRQNFRTYVGGEVNDTAKRALVGIDYFNQRAEMRLAHSSSFLDNGNGRIQSTQLSFGTGLAFTTKGFAVTKPVEDAFVLVSMPDRPKGYNVPIGRGVDSQRGEINRFGPASVTNIAPYFTDKINLDIAELPYGYVLKKETYDFYPSYRSGIHITVAVEGEVSVNGRAEYDDGKPASYINGSIFEVNDDKSRGELVAQFFTGGEGEFSAERLEKKDYILSFESGEKVYKDVFITVTKSVGVQEIEEVIKLVLDRR